MAVDIVQLNNALVFRDSTSTWRIYDAFGAAVTKYLQDFVTWPADDTTGDPTEWKVTVTEAGDGDSTAVITDAAGGALLMTTAANDNDGINMQLGGAAGESVMLDDEYILYAGIRAKLSEATQSDFFFGVGVTDTDWSGGITDGIYFRKVDASTTINFVTEKDSVESVAAVGTLADDTYIILEFYFDGTTVHSYVNGVLTSSQAATAATFPDNEALRLTIEFLAGAATAKTATIDWVRMVHIR